MPTPGRNTREVKSASWPPWAVTMTPRTPVQPRDRGEVRAQLADRPGRVEHGEVKASMTRILTWGAPDSRELLGDLAAADARPARRLPVRDHRATAAACSIAAARRAWS